MFAAVIIFGIMGFKVTQAGGISCADLTLSWQAHATYDACVSSNYQLMNQSSASGEGWVVVDGENRTLPVCDLQEQLEKVRLSRLRVRFFHLLLSIPVC